MTATFFFKTEIYQLANSLTAMSASFFFFFQATMEITKHTKDPAVQLPLTGQETMPLLK